jgi:pSer/pThr/pTyr-binding forkhead associated (FHA) protein
MAKLTIKDEKGVERVHELIDAVTSIGRASGNSIHVTDAKFSRQHFKVEKDGEFYRIVDLGSTNGTRVNGVKVTSQQLRPGDVLKVGDTTFTYDGPGEPAPPPPAQDAGIPEIAPPKPAPQADGPRYVLAVIEGADPGKRYDLGRDAITLGRHPSNTIQIDDESASTYHAEIKKEPIGYVLSDLGSTNGTRTKAKGAESFEKIVKAPLAVGMQIRIGKTVLEYRNIGAPSADDQIFGTVALDPEKLGDRLADRPKRSAGGATALVAVLCLGVFAGVIFLVLRFVPNAGENDKAKGKDKQPPAAVSTDNLVPNAGFSLGMDDQGNPVGWKPTRGQPVVRVTINTEHDATANPPPEQKKAALEVNKTGATSPSCRTFVMTEDRVSVDPGRAYELGGAMKNDGDGLFGLRVTWCKGDRRATEHPLVLVGSQPEWKERSRAIRPPPWADRAQVGVFTEGREGKTYFDNIVFKAASGAAPSPPAVSFGRVGVQFEGTAGAFAASADGQPVLEWNDLELLGASGEPVASLLSAISPQLAVEGKKASLGGQLFDFTLQKQTSYRIAASPGSWGVEISFAVDRGDNASVTPSLSFYLVGPAARGDLEVGKGGQYQTLAAQEKHKVSGVQEVLFNAGGAPQLYLKLAPAVEFETRREGEKRLVQISFPSELTMELAPENVGARQQLTQMLRTLEDHLGKRNWAPAAKLAEEAEKSFGARFPEAKQAATKMRIALDEAFRPDREAIQDQLRAMANLRNFDAVEDLVKKKAQAWVGTKYETEFSGWLESVVQARRAHEDSLGEQKAQELLKRAQDQLANKNYQVCISLCNKLVREHPNSKAAAVAKELLAKAEAANKEQDQLNAITSRLKDRARPFTNTGDWAGAIQEVEKDTEYQKYRTQLTEIGDLLKAWRQKRDEQK